MAGRFVLAVAAMMMTAYAGQTAASKQKPETFKVDTTAYCLQGRTASGLPVDTGTAAADPDLLPLGSVVRLSGVASATPYDGEYVILDTGRHIQGRRIDIHIPKCGEARRFGRRTMVVEVVRRGWPEGANPSEPSPGSANR